MRDRYLSTIWILCGLTVRLTALCNKDNRTIEAEADLAPAVYT